MANKDTAGSTLRGERPRHQSALMATPGLGESTPVRRVT